MATDLQKIPGVGKKIAESFKIMGFHSVEELRGQDPQELYDRWCLIEGCQVDRCVLYVYRCAVYFAETEHPDPEKLKWWNWKD
ncbi:helix-hairpin-helix domain-containing protein [Zongyangia hominis]|uniref:Pathogenicity locus n=1 Tax=Zongyangia hominis TaxID=2763677 RepID=A0A926I6R0_9FIRM|nr:helix-hairpin-helix domain-containing protein [Zongyangia hominis]MBC8570314.1 Pathogenicity locus [Zongyangia hominis]